MNFIDVNIEQIENLFGLAVLVVCAAMMFAKRTWPSAEIRLFARGFVGAGLLGDSCWTIYTFVFGHSPQYFYGEELAWLAEELFLLLLIVEVYGKEGLSPINPTAWIGPIVIAALSTWYVAVAGDPVLNILMGCAMSGIALFSLSALLNTKEDRSKGITRHTRFYVATVCFVALEYILWSCSAVDGTVSISNPYYWVGPLVYVAILCITLTVMRFKKFHDGDGD
ncbi:MAG: hypothetical protein Q4D34_00160 [Eggerthellaceae bacterium]|nr:hypothetical protein [Eggerthellaceae bacterium]